MRKDPAAHDAQGRIDAPLEVEFNTRYLVDPGDEQTN